MTTKPTLRCLFNTTPDVAGSDSCCYRLRISCRALVAEIGHFSVHLAECL
jgi:hypothetical protein